MPVLIVGKEKNLAQLRSRLIEGRLSREANERLTAAIRDANPHVDLKRLKPGTVLTIPKLPEVRLRPKIDVLSDPGAPAESIVGELVAALGEMERVGAEQGKTARAQRVALGRTLKLKALDSRAKRDKVLKQNIAAANESLSARQEAAKQAEADLKAATSTWADGLARLQDLGLGGQ